MSTTNKSSSSVSDSENNTRQTEVAAIHKTIRTQGEKELGRTVSALLWSAIAAGMSMSFSMLAIGLIKSHLPDNDIGVLISSLGYAVGFIVVILAHQQLFTENTVTAVLPLVTEPGLYKLFYLLRLWSVVLIGNLIGVAISAYLLLAMPLFDSQTQEVFIGLGEKILSNDTGQMFAKGAIAGWMIATMVWLIPAAGDAKVWVILIVTSLIGLGGFTHIIVGSTEVLYLVFDGKASMSDYVFKFALPTLLGNVVGGTFIFALISHAQVRSDN
ncbi:formate/nitrite transporter family protein [Halomonas sp. M20]|uniref:formate/nitrite transporter family protein n=1 Tax=Halomonas sp. M20 TaxID=2763264 RepID=UPI001D0B6A3C|nr:formate/nitrite transporter family protein [Halomonas sp. M20]